MVQNFRHFTKQEKYFVCDHFFSVLIMTNKPENLLKFKFLVYHRKQHENLFL